MYCEDPQSKTNQGGLKSKKTPKRVKLYQHSDSDRCVVRRFEKYTGLLPKELKCSAFYKYELSEKRQTGHTWFTDKPVGINVLRTTVKEMMSKARISGKFTNHSLRVSAATRMYQSGIDEQVIKERTGHSSDAVRKYKRTNEGLLKQAFHAASGDKEVNLPLIPPDACIDEIDLTKEEKQYKAYPDKSSKAHKAKCPMSDSEGNCPKICDVLKKLDQVKTEPKIKKMRLSLKYRK